MVHVSLSEFLQNRFYKQLITEGIHDKNILKVVFLAGGPGSGKTFVTKGIFGFPNDLSSTVSYSTGLKVINSDASFEYLLKKNNMKVSELPNYKNNPELWNKAMEIRAKAKNLTKTIRDTYLPGRLGLIIDGTGKDYGKIAKMSKRFEDLGYDTFMVFVNTSLDVALERNAKRERTVPEDLVKDMWTKVQQNIGKFQNFFGRQNFIIVDNNEYGRDDLIKIAEKEINKLLRQPLKNPIGKKWIQNQL